MDCNTAASSSALTYPSRCSRCAEARLAARLMSGDGINAAAIALGVSRETARTQLKAVFAKTNTHRQAELATLVTRLRPYA